MSLTRQPWTRSRPRPGGGPRLDGSDRGSKAGEVTSTSSRPSSRSSCSRPAQALDLRRPLKSPFGAAQGAAPRRARARAVLGRRTVRPRRRSKGRGRRSKGPLLGAPRAARMSVRRRRASRARTRAGPEAPRSRASARAGSGRAGRESLGRELSRGTRLRRGPAAAPRAARRGRHRKTSRERRSRATWRRGTPPRKQARGLGASDPETVVETVEGAEEVREVREKAESEDPSAARRRVAPPRDAPERAFPRSCPSGGRSAARRSRGARRARRRREEVETPRRGRGVEDDEVDPGVGRVLVQSLHPHVLEDAGQRVDESRVEAVPVDSPERFGARDAREKPLEGRLRVDLQGEEAAATRDAGARTPEGLPAASADEDRAPARDAARDPR